MNILVLHGPNLNLLGERETTIYGTMTYAELNARLRAHARKLGATLRIAQSNCEGKLIDLIHANRRWADGMVFNPGAYAHYSYALRDAVAAADIPTIEAHLTKILRREPFRRKSVIAPVCLKLIAGRGVYSYLQALDCLSRLPGKNKAA
ncbi:MAG: 3-dehydroquinate dehydratase [Elusimicrobia bacterium]|nr:3-dehydroquinate dehydratase [Elusimicrobiota bacterium]